MACHATYRKWGNTKNLVVRTGKIGGWVLLILDFGATVRSRLELIATEIS